jgi:hypothetical protein
MMKRPAGNSAKVLPQATTKYLEHQHCESARDVYQTLHTSGLDKFTYSLIDSLWNDLSTMVHHLERLPEDTFKELMGVIQNLREARNELRHARFLFDVEEINSVHRLLMRNRAVLRGKHILHKVLMVWPLHSSS